MGFLELIIIGVVLIGLFVGITLWITGGNSSGSSEMSCGGCGYAVRGLGGVNCPECGADLRKVGINRPKGGANRGVGIALTLICFLFVAGLVVFGLFVNMKTAQTPPAMPTQTPLSTPSQPAPSPPSLPSDGTSADTDEEQPSDPATP